ncbi:MAG: superoxide dismutase [Rikenellaceae bacterium]
MFNNKLFLVAMIFTVAPLPYPTDGLEPLMSRETLDYHWGKHYAGYVAKLNELIAGSEFEDFETLEDIMLRSTGVIYNNAAQAWNHRFFFEQFSISPKQEVEGALKSALDRDFGGYDLFAEKFAAAALSLFGSGWVWLVSDEGGKLSIVATQNAKNPATEDGLTPLMVIDLWEHAYYIDHRNRRADFIKNFMALLDWKVVESRYL